MKEFGLWFLCMIVYVLSLSGFGIRVILASQNEPGNILLFFGKSLERVGVNSF